MSDLPDDYIDFQFEGIVNGYSLTATKGTPGTEQHTSSEENTEPEQPQVQEKRIANHLWIIGWSAAIAAAFATGSAVAHIWDPFGAKPAVAPSPTPSTPTAETPLASPASVSEFPLTIPSKVSSEDIVMGGFRLIVSR
jgi:hypothetical protein